MLPAHDRAPASARRLQAAANALAVWNEVVAAAPTVEYMQRAMLVRGREAS